MTTLRRREVIQIDVDGVEYSVEIVEVPFREGVEFRCLIGEEEVRVGDRGLGEAEARRLLVDEIRRTKQLLGD
jgi:hypothetical protein